MVYVRKLFRTIGLKPRKLTKEAKAAAAGISYEQPQVEAGSTLDFMLSTLSREAAAAYVHAVVSDIEACVAESRATAQDVGPENLLERIHALKNAIAPIGSQQLRMACEQLRLDACHGADRAPLERRFEAVARAAVKLILSFRAASGP